MDIFRKLKSDTRGSTLMELAFTMPILVLMVMGGTELSLYMLNHQKLNRVAMSSADLISQSRQVTEAEIRNVFDAIDYVAGTTDFNQNGVLILTAVHKEGDNPPVISWQRMSNADYAANSHVGSTQGSAAQLPETVTLNAGDGVVIAEVFYSFKPLIYEKVVGDSQIYHVAYYRPRFGALREVKANDAQL